MEHDPISSHSRRRRPHFRLVSRPSPRQQGSSAGPHPGSTVMTSRLLRVPVASTSSTPACSSRTTRRPPSSRRPGVGQNGAQTGLPVVGIGQSADVDGADRRGRGGDEVDPADGEHGRPGTRGADDDHGDGGGRGQDGEQDTGAGPPALGPGGGLLRMLRHRGRPPRGHRRGVPPAPGGRPDPRASSRGRRAPPPRGGRLRGPPPLRRLTLRRAGPHPARPARGRRTDRHAPLVHRLSSREAPEQHGQSRPALCTAALHGADGDLQDRRGLGHGIALHVDEHHCDPLFTGTIASASPTASRVTSSTAGSGCWEWKVASATAPSGAPARCSDPVDAGVDDYPPQPRAHRGVATERRGRR